MFNLTNSEVLMVARMARAFTATGADVETMASIRRKAQAHVNALSREQLEQLAQADAVANLDPLKIALDSKASPEE